MDWEEFTTGIWHNAEVNGALVSMICILHLINMSSMKMLMQKPHFQYK